MKQRAERIDAKRQARIEILKEQTIRLVEENILVQHSLIRSGYIPLTPEESEMCKLEAIVQACKKSLLVLEKLKGYNKEDYDFMRKLINSRKPLFNSELSERFTRVLQELVDRPFDLTQERRAHHPDARNIEDFIAEDLKDRWMVCRVKFIKAYYFWEVVYNQATCSKLDALHNFMVVYDEELWRTILITAELAEPKLILKIPEKVLFPRPKIAGTIIVDREMIDRETREALQFIGIYKSSNA